MLKKKLPLILIINLTVSPILYAEQNITVLPGSLLSRDTHQDSSNNNPGVNKIRMALVAPLEECQDAANRINTLLSHF